MKRRGALFVLAGAVALVVAAGVAFAATVKCQGGMTTLCVGTDGPDKLYGTYKPDGMNARQGDDLLFGRRAPTSCQATPAAASRKPPTATISSTATGAMTGC